MNKKEQRRLVVLNQVAVGKMIGREAAELLGLSLRHVRRMLAAYRKDGWQFDDILPRAVPGYQSSTTRGSSA